MKTQSDNRNSESAITFRSFRAEDEHAVIDLWQRCDLIRPWNNPHEDIAIKMTTQPELFLVGEQDSKLIATAMAGFDGHRGWVSYFAVDPGLQGQGIGRSLMAEVERLLKLRGVPKINLQVRTSNKDVIAFYQSLGFKIDDVVGMGKRLDGK